MCGGGWRLSGSFFLGAYHGRGDTMVIDARFLNSQKSRKEMSNKKLMQARCLLLAREPWYGHAASALSWIEDDKCPTMAVSVSSSGKPVCRYGREFIHRCSIYEVATVIQHEIEHIVRQHCRRLTARNPELANIACDMVINGHKSSPAIGIADASGQKQIPSADRIAWLPEYWPTTMTAEECYRRLKEETPPEWSGKLPKLMDEHEDWAKTAGNGHSSHAATSIVQAGQASGTSAPGGLRSHVDELVAAKINWAIALRNFAKSSLKKKRPSFNRRSRRVDLFGMPGKRIDRTSRVSVIVDVSGSVSTQVLQTFFSEIESLMSRARISVLCWDHAHQGYMEHYQRGDWKTLCRGGGGGTDMAAPVSWLREHAQIGDCLIMLTDGYCDWPEKQPFPFLVVCSTAKERITEPTWGRTIYLEP